MRQRNHGCRVSEPQVRSTRQLRPGVQFRVRLRSSCWTLRSMMLTFTRGSGFP